MIDRMKGHVAKDLRNCPQTKWMRERGGGPKARVKEDASTDIILSSISDVEHRSIF